MFTMQQVSIALRLARRHGSAAAALVVVESTPEHDVDVARLLRGFASNSRRSFGVPSPAAAKAEPALESQPARFLERQVSQ